MASSLQNDLPSVEVRNIGGAKGRGLFALRKFSAGEILFEEKPLVCSQFLWNRACGYLACDFCLRPLESAQENVSRLTSTTLELPYPQCCATRKEQHVDCPHCEVTYCSQECLDQAWDQYHRTLCVGSQPPEDHPLERLENAWRQMHYPPETASIMLIARMIASVKQAKDKEGAIHLFSQFCHRTVNEEEEIAHKLLGEKFQVQVDSLNQLMCKALYEDDLHHWFTPEGFRSLIALVGTNGQGIGTSALSMWVRNCDQLDLSPEESEKLDQFITQIYEKIEAETGCFLNNEGSGLYPLQSSCNHSCVPNAEPTFPYNNFILVMEAVTDIEPGEEIQVCYLDECNRAKSRHSRIKILRENYLFTCTCSKCQSQATDPDVTSEEEMEEEEEETN